MKLSRVALAFLLLSSLTFAADAVDLSQRYDRWQPKVDRYLERDKANPPPLNGIVFTGSSSMEMWTSLQKDFPDLPVVRRGIGSTWLLDQLTIAPKLVYPLQPHTVVLYAGENDLQDNRTVAEVVDAFEQVRAQIFAALPSARLVFLALKPSPSRTAILEKMRESNDRIADLCVKDPRCTFVDVFTPMLDATGQPRPELYLADRLHMTPEGYRLWTGLVAPVLDRVFSDAASASP